MNMDDTSDLISDEEVANLSKILKSKLEPLVFNGQVKQPKRNSRLVISVSGVAAALAIAIAIPIFGVNQSTSWAADPHSLSDSQRSAISQACGNVTITSTASIIPLSLGSGANPAPLSSSGAITVTTDTGSSTTITADSAPTTSSSAEGTLFSTQPSTTAMTLIVSPSATIDFRGSGGIVVSSNPSGVDACTFIKTDSGFKATSGTSLNDVVGQAAISSSSGIGGVISIDGKTSVRSYTGLLAPMATRVVLSADGIKSSDASIYDGHFAIWWPAGTKNSVLTQYDISGKVITRISVPN